MNIDIISFTHKGMNLSLHIQKKLSNSHNIKCFAKYESFKKEDNREVTFVDGPLSEWTYKKQLEKVALIFIGSIGIAVRMISVGIRDKLQDAPVIVVDELGQYVVPILSGHVGGGNLLATQIAKEIGAVPIITTATDLEEVFSIDLFAKENNLAIVNKDGIAKVSSKALEGKLVRLSIENFPRSEADVVISSDSTYLHNGVLGLCPRKYAVGIGCRKGTSCEGLEAFLLKVLEDNNINTYEIGAIGSIDIKENEEGIIELSRKLNIPFITFSAKILSKAKGEYVESSFVQKNVGVGNVCERAAMLLTENQGEIIVNKISRDGMTLAIAKID